ncbi:hypothetical protein FRB91_001215 [Serendipita sp. 411]|nr:hypothetical protein FRB91_001215 [Serendipita sp. 411]
MSVKQDLNICIVGFGAIGTIYGWLLNRSGDAKITAVCRSNYDSLVEHGVDIDSTLYGTEKSWRPHRIFRTVEEAADQEYDFVIGCFKTIPDLNPTPNLLGPLLQKTKSFVLIQNGIGIECDLQRASPKATVISGCAWIDCTLVDNYRTLRHGGLNKLVIGAHLPLSSNGQATLDELKEDGEKSLRLLCDTFHKGGFEPTETGNIVAERWRKNLWNAAFSTLATLSRADLFQIYAKELWEINHVVVKGLMNEVVSVARAIGIAEELLPSSAVDDTIGYAYTQYSDPTKGKPFKPSMLVDLEAGRPMEVEGIVGEVVRQAKEVGVAVPRLETAYAGLKILQRRLINKA